MKVLAARLLTAAAFIGVGFFGSLHASIAAITPGQVVALTATADGTAPFTYQWYKNGGAVIGATGSSYSFSSFQVTDAGTYSAVISNSVGSVTSDEAVLTLAINNVVPNFTLQPVSQTVIAGVGVTFTAAANGTPVPVFQWQKNGVPITGATSASYTLSTTSLNDRGSYTVVATNSVGAVSSNAATLSVNPVSVAPSITTQPASQTVIVGASVTFTATVIGTPTPMFQWRKGGVNISGATSSSYTLAGVSSTSAGPYSVVVTNSAGAITSNTATLTVNPAPAAPTLTTQPVNQVVAVGGSITFSVTASGTPTPTFQWMKNGLAIVGATNASYVISSATTADIATYSLVATNSVGAVTSNAATLSVTVPPRNLVVRMIVQ